jgi:hypothetical protein
MKNQKDWMLNAMMRSRLLVDLWHDKTRAIGIFDSDIVFKKPEHVSLWTNEYKGYDIVIRDRGADIVSHGRYCAGIIRFQPTPSGIAVLKEWARLCEKDEEPLRKLREQHYLYKAIKNINPEVFVLDGRWDCIPHRNNETVIAEDAIVVHLPASRIERDKVQIAEDWNV